MSENKKRFVFFFNSNELQKEGSLPQLNPLEGITEGFMEEASFELNYRS